MSKGVLFVAFDSTTDQGNELRYTELAKISANLAKHYLGLPVGIVTDKSIVGFDEQIIVSKPESTTRHVVVNSKHESYNWYNDYRRHLFDLTPWDQTLLLDVDYFLQTPRYLKCFEANLPFQIIGSVFDPTGRNSFEKYRYLPNRTIPQAWATAIYWNKDSKTFFDYANMISDNYKYYARVFGFSDQQFRNDMVFSIVNHMLSGYTMPFKMWMTGSDCRVTEATPNGLKFNYSGSVLRIKNDVHVLSKEIMLDNNLEMLYDWSKNQ